MSVPQQEIAGGTVFFRPAVIEDAPFVARAILEAVGIENPPAEMLAAQSEFSRREDVLYSWRNTVVAEVGGKVVGSLTAYDGRNYRRMRAVTFPLIREMCGKDFTDMADETCAGEFYLDSMFVLPEFRRRGIATALLKNGIERARKLRIPCVSLLVSPEKPDAERLYWTVGFEKSEVIFAFNENYNKMWQHIHYQPLLEVCAASLASARTAERASAPRIELCRRLDLGGLTPAHSDIETCVRELNLQTFVLIRPRGGDFCYSEEELQTIIDDVRFCRRVGVPGVVVGFLNADGSVNTDHCRRVMEEARGMEVTFHRAFDRCTDWRAALEQIIDCGFTRILTSGQQPTALQGLDTLKCIQRQAAGRIAILAGSGVNAGNARRILQEAGVTEVHGSCKISGYESDEAEIRRTLEEVGKVRSEK